MNKRMLLPKVNKNDTVCQIPSPTINTEEKVLFSYMFLDTDNDYYNCNGLCDKGILDWFSKMREISNIDVKQLHAGQYTRSPLRFHHHHPNEKDSHDWPSFFADHPELEDDFCQLRFGKSNGGIHGVLIGNVFYVIWADPHHWFYHNERYGRKLKLKKPGDCCRYRDEELEAKDRELMELKKQLAAYEELLDEKTNQV